MPLQRSRVALQLSEVKPIRLPKAAKRQRSELAGAESASLSIGISPTDDAQNEALFSKTAARLHTASGQAPLNAKRQPGNGERP